MTTLDLRATIAAALAAPGAPTQAALCAAVAPTWGVSPESARQSLSRFLAGRGTIPLRAIEAILAALQSPETVPPIQRPPPQCIEGDCTNAPAPGSKRCAGCEERHRRAVAEQKAAKGVRRCRVPGCGQLGHNRQTCPLLAAVAPASEDS